MQNPHLDQVKRLSRALIVSGAFNIVLICFFFYWIVSERPPTPYFESKPAEKREQQVPLAIDRTNSEIIISFKALSKEQLLAKLAHTQLVENGYTQRDLALGCLVAFHHFDLSRALQGLPLSEQQRPIAFGVMQDGKPAEIIVYPGLSDQHYQLVMQFVDTERWPLTSKGLFLTLKHHQGEPETSLYDAFFLTPEFLAVETLFNRSEISVDKQQLLNVLKDGEWHTLSAFVEQQRISNDLSSARRQRFLLDYIQTGSKAAASLLLKIDPEFAAKKIDDEHVLMILKVLSEKSPEAQKFATELLTSPRSDAVWKMASNRLYEYAGEPSPEKFQHHAALKRFVPQNTLIKQPPVNVFKAAPVNITKPAPQALVKQSLNQRPPNKIAQNMPRKKERLYVVQEGDSLWKISRRFNIDVEIVKKYNQLNSDFLKPGTTLKLPL